MSGIVEANTVVDPVWELSKPQVTKEVGTARVEYVEFKATNDISNGKTLNFEVQCTDTGNYYDYQKAYLNLEFNLYRNDGNKITKADKTAICAEILKVYSKSELRFNDVTIQAIDEPGMVAYVLDLVEKSIEAKETRQDVEWSYDIKRSDGLTAWTASSALNTDGVSNAVSADSSFTGASSGQERQFLTDMDIDGAGAVSTLSISENESYDPHYARRIRRMEVNESQLLSVNIPLVKMFAALKGLPVTIGSKLKLLFNRHTDASDARYIYGNYNLPTKLRITRHSVWAPRVQPSLEVQSSVQAFLNSGTKLRHTFLHPSFYQLTNQKPTTRHSWQVTTNHRRPKYIFLALARADRQTHRQVNPLCFDSDYVSGVECRVNQMAFPTIPHLVEAKEHNVRLLTEIHKMGRQFADDEDSSLVDLEQFLTHKAVYCFDVSAMPESAFKSRQLGDVELNWTISNPDDKVYFDAVAVVISERELEMIGIDGEMKFLTSGL